MSHKQPARLDSVHVLLVEDDDDSREVLTTVLGYCGALVTAVANALDAIRFIARITPAVLVTDIALPERDGFWLLDTIRSLPHAKSIPVIAVTGHYDAERVRAAGFNKCLRKPVDVDRLCEAIRDAMPEAHRPQS